MSSVSSQKLREVSLVFKTGEPHEVKSWWAEPGQAGAVALHWVSARAKNAKIAAQLLASYQLVVSVVQNYLSNFATLIEWLAWAAWPAGVHTVRDYSWRTLAAAW